MNDVQSALYETMQLFSQQAVTKDTTVTIEAEINDIIDEGLGLYSISYEGNKELKAYTTDSNIKYKKNDKVYVIIPNGDFGKSKFIIGAVAPTSRNKTDDSEPVYRQLTDNLIKVNNKPFALCSYNSETKKIPISYVYDSATLNNFFVNCISEKHNTFTFSCQIKTNLTPTQQSKGDYGAFLTIGNEKIELSVKNFSGNPYNMGEWTLQSKSFQINNPNNTNISLSIFCKDFIQNSQEQSDDIWFQDFALINVAEISNNQSNELQLSLAATQGDFFNDYTSPEKTITPKLYIGNKETSLNGYECYWFKENAQVRPGYSAYSPFGGVGWECLNEKTKVTSDADGFESFQFITNQYTLNIREAYIYFKVNYKCVVVVGDNIISAQIQIKNFKNNIKFTLEPTTGIATFIKDIGVVDLTAKLFYDNITNDENNNGNFVYEWLRLDKNGKYLDDNFYKIIYENKMQNNNFITQITFPSYLIEDFNIIKCSAFYYEEKNGEIIKRMLGTAELLVSVSEDFTYRLSIQNGEKIYKYDSDGDSPLVANYDGPISSRIKAIPELGFKLYNQQGNELSSEEYQQCDITWMVPKNSLYIISSEPNSSDNTYNYFKTSTLNYSIKNKYIKTTNNEITLKVIFDGCELVETANIQFLKDGEGGTNGTKYAAVLTYGGYEFNELVNGVNEKLTLIYNDGNNKEYKFFTQTKGLFDAEAANRFKVKVYEDGSLVPEQNYRVSFSMFDKKHNKDKVCIEVSAEHKPIVSLPVDINAQSIFTNVVQATITIISDKTELYCYYPIDYIYLNNPSGIDIKAIPQLKGGFDQVIYASDGTYPKYDSSIPFFCENDLFAVQNYKWSKSENLKLDIAPEQESSQVQATPIAKFNNGINLNYIRAMHDFTESSSNIDLANLTDAIAQQEKIIQQADNTITYFNILKNNFDKDNYLNLLDNNRDVLSLIKNIRDIMQDLLSCAEDKNIEKQYKNIFIVNKKDYRLELIQEIRKIIAQQKTLVHLNGEEYSIWFFKDFKTLENLLNTLIQLWGTRSLVSDDLVEKTYCADWISQLVQLKDTANNQTGVLGSKEEVVVNFGQLYLQLNQLKNKLNQYSILSGYTSIKTNLTYYLSIISFANSYEDIENAIKDLYSNLITKYFNNNILNNRVTSDIGVRKSQAAAELDKLKQQKDLYINSNGLMIAYVHPIVFLYNRYEMSNLNGWDGNKVEIKDGYILAPQIGAGIKENDNSFTGIVIGERKVNNQSDTGLFGYHKGEQSIFLDAADGSAIFGLNGEGQIILKPAGSSTIAGCNLTNGGISTNNWAINNDGSVSFTKGKIANCNINNNAISTNNWSINSDGSASFGNISATGGTIGGWTISNDSLSGKGLTLKAGEISGTDWKLNKDILSNINLTNATGGFTGQLSSSGGLSLSGKSLTDINEIVAKKITADYIKSRVEELNLLNVKGSIYCNSLFLNTDDGEASVGQLLSYLSASLSALSNRVSALENE